MVRLTERGVDMVIEDYSLIAPGASGTVYDAAQEYESGYIDRDELVGRLQCIDDDAQDALEEGDITPAEFDMVMADIAKCMDEFGLDYTDTLICTGHEGD